MAKRCRLEGSQPSHKLLLFNLLHVCVRLVMFLKYLCADASGFILFPLVVHSFDLIVSAIGILSIRGTRDPGSKSLVEDPMAILQKGYSVTIVLAIIAFCGVRYFILLYFYV